MEGYNWVQRWIVHYEYTYGEIAEELTRMEKEDGNGRIWNKTPVVNLLRSETYIGNYLSNKECRIVDEYGVVKRVKNKGQVEQILIEGHHPALGSLYLRCLWPFPIHPF